MEDSKRSQRDIRLHVKIKITKGITKINKNRQKRKKKE